MLESPQNGYVVDDENLTKYQLKQELVKLQKLGKEAILSSVFEENRKVVQKFHDIIVQDDELKSMAFIDTSHNFKFGEVYCINKDIFKVLGNQEIIYVAIPKLDEVVAIFKYEKGEKVYGKNHTTITCTKSLIWKDENEESRRLSDIIKQFYFKKLGYTSLLSDDFYTPKGKKSLFHLLSDFIYDGYIYFVDSKDIKYRIDTKQDLEYNFAKYFGDSKDFSKYKFLLSTKEIKL